jgi:polyhydroxyalkanoate synthesis regulator phasin
MAEVPSPGSAEFWEAQKAKIPPAPVFDKEIPAFKAIPLGQKSNMAETPLPGSAEFWEAQKANIPPVPVFDKEIPTFNMPKQEQKASDNNGAKDPATPDSTPLPETPLVTPSEVAATPEAPKPQEFTPDQQVNVKRSSGVIESDWKIIYINGDEIIVSKPTGEGDHHQIENVNADDLRSWNTETVTPEPIVEPEPKIIRKFVIMDPVNVRRPDGSMESDWIVTKIEDDNVTVMKKNSDHVFETVKLDDLSQWNQNHEVVVPEPETPPVNPEQQLAPLTPEQQEQVIKLDQYARTTKERENAREEEHYKGRWGKAQHWMQTTGWGRAVKIGAKVVLGTAAALSAGALLGTAGLLAAPIIYSLGAKTAIDGGIEAAQYYLGKNGGRNRRLAIEAAKNELNANAAKAVDGIEAKVESGEINPEQGAFFLNELAKEIRKREEAIMNAQNADMAKDRKETAIRTVASTVAAIGLGLLTGVPLGFQHFSKESIGHTVKLTTHGFGFIHRAADAMSHVDKLAGEHQAYKVLGGMAHGLGHAMPVLGKIGVGAAIVGLFAKFGWDLKKATQNRNISELPPDFITFSNVSPNSPAPESPVQEPGSTPVADTGTEDSVFASENPENADYDLPLEEDSEPTNESPASEPDKSEPTAENIFHEKPKDFQEFVKLVREKMNDLREEYTKLEDRYKELAKAWQEISPKKNNTPADMEKLQKIEDEQDLISEKMTEINNGIEKLEEANRLIRELEVINEKIGLIEEDEYQNLLDKDEKTAEDIKRIEEIETLMASKPETDKKLHEIYENFNITPETNADFTEASEREQADRFKRLTTLFEKSDTENASEDGDFMEFLDEAPDRINIPDMEPYQQRLAYNQAKRSSEIVKKALMVFSARKQEQAEMAPAVEQYVKTLESSGTGFIDPTTGKIDISHIAKNFEWAITAYQQSNTVLGRKPAKFAPREIALMRKDLESILSQVANRN